MLIYAIQVGAHTFPTRRSSLNCMKRHLWNCNIACKMSLRRSCRLLCLTNSVCLRFQYQIAKPLPPIERIWNDDITEAALQLTLSARYWLQPHINRFWAHGNCLETFQAVRMGVPFEALIPYGIMLAVGNSTLPPPALLTSLMLDVWHHRSRHGEDQTHAKRRKTRAAFSGSVGQGTESSQPWPHETLVANDHIANDGSW
jgi:hypothetical protein